MVIRKVFVASRQDLFFGKAREVSLPTEFDLKHFHM
ncbi:MAG: hypothetical protein S4CHLAM6_13780 [Chlamydiae bacterium]|nr:hypothetical protein [Chlamydiota bacterium]